ncbi:hypothetical protein C1646_305445 [Rhizophagus diaphanus]|nr:hypothetical protein C1646_305445 [Rhizophagus diaphanus] [Rhizophagus sp. MUCL 43196]
MDLLKSFLNLHPNSRLSGKLKPRNNFEMVDSKIIAFQHFELFSKWVDKLDITDDPASYYEFKLMFRGSRDRFGKFHEICDNQPRIITIIKVKDCDRIVGGYSPIGWNAAVGDYSKTRESFIFSFGNSDSNENYILSRVVNEYQAIWNSRAYGPTFGDKDLVLYGDNFCSSYSKKCDYEKPIRETEDEFSVEEIEVFQITKT